MQATRDGAQAKVHEMQAKMHGVQTTQGYSTWVHARAERRRCAAEPED